jgi:hypothetical protein
MHSVHYVVGEEGGQINHFPFLISPINPAPDELCVILTFKA